MSHTIHRTNRIKGEIDKLKTVGDLNILLPTMNQLVEGQRGGVSIEQHYVPTRPNDIVERSDDSGIRNLRNSTSNINQDGSYAWP